MPPLKVKSHVCILDNMGYTPPFTVSSRSITLVAQIAERVAKLSASGVFRSDPKLRRLLSPKEDGTIIQSSHSFPGPGLRNHFFWNFPSFFWRIIPTPCFLESSLA